MNPEVNPAQQIDYSQVLQQQQQQIQQLQQQMAQQQQQNEVVRQGSLLSKVHVAPSDYFTGDTRKTRQFLALIKNIFTMLAITVAVVQIRWVGTKMEKAGETFFQNISTQNLIDNMSWDEFERRFLERFADTNEFLRARQTLNNLRHKDSVRTLVSLMDEVCTLIPDVTDNEKVDKLLQKIRPDIGTKLYEWGVYGKSWTEVCAYAIRLDDCSTFYKNVKRPVVERLQFNNAGNNGAAPMELGAMQASTSGSDTTKLPGNRHLPKYDTYGRPRCFECGKYGHIGAHCPDPQPRKAANKRPNQS